MTSKSTIATTAFWIASLERAIKTAAQVLIAQIGTDAVGVTNLDWPQMLGITATAVVLSLLTSVASDHIGPEPGPSIVATPQLSTDQPKEIPDGT
jgi:hypothetical protein